jgi:hypothetical protein
MLGLLLTLTLAQGDALDAGALPPPPPPPSDVERQTLAPAPSSAPPPGAASGEPLLNHQVRVRLRDGQVLTGKLLLRREDGALLLQLATGPQLTLPAETITEVVDDSAEARRTEWFSDPNRTRYLYGPSAMMLKRNEFSFSQTELLVSGFSWGATDWLSVQLAGAVPLWFISFPTAFNLLLSVKAGGKLANNVHLAGGVQALWVPAFGNTNPSGGSFTLPVVGVGFLTGTYGTSDLHASLSVAMPFSGYSGLATGSPIVTVSANWRLTRGFALVTENWFIFGVQQVVDPLGTPHVEVTVATANGLAARIMGEHFAVDLGFLVLQAGGTFVPFPVPWVNFTYNWGGVTKP